MLAVVCCRFKFLWHDVVLVTDPAALASIMGRGEHSVDKAFETYAPINKMCDPHGQVCDAVTGTEQAMWDAGFDVMSVGAGQVFCSFVRDLLQL